MTWKSYKRRYIQRHHPIVCALCGKNRFIDFHHIIPTSVEPKLQFEESNIIPLCRIHHFIFGHRSNWSDFNPYVREDIERMKLFTFKYIN